MTTIRSGRFWGSSVGLGERKRIGIHSQDSCTAHRIHAGSRKRAPRSTGERPTTLSLGVCVPLEPAGPWIYGSHTYRHRTSMAGIISYGNRKRTPDCCSRPKQLRTGGGSGKPKKDRQSRRTRGTAGGGRAAGARRRRRSGEIVRRLPKHAEARLRLESRTRDDELVDALSNAKKRPPNGFRTSILKLVDSTFDAALWDRAGRPADIFVAANKQDVVNGAAGDGDGGGSVVGASIMCENNSGPGHGAGGRKRGHQHHPRFGGTRQSTVPAEDVIAALRGAFDGGSNSLSSSSLSSSASSLNVSISGGGGGGSGDRAVTANDGSNNNNPLATEKTTSFATRSDDNDAELLDEYDIGTEAIATTPTTTTAAIATADIVNSNIENSSITALGAARWSGEPSKENTPEPEQDRLNNNRSISSSSNRSSVSPKHVILFDEAAGDADGRPALPAGPPSRTTEPDDEESIELKLDQITSGKELVQQISKKLKRSKRSPQSDDAGGAPPASGKKKSSSTGKKSSSKISSSSGGTGADGGKRKKSKSSAAAAAAAAAALEQRASGDGASCGDLDAVIGGLLGAAEYGGGLAGDYKEQQPNDENDPDVAEWAKLRCTSERTEVIAEREHRRQKRCADYPGLAFGRSIFSSDTMMKFNIIRNELHNIMKTQLKRAESEVAALNRRIQLLEEDLERSEERLASATAKLSEASAAADESERIRKALENRTNMEDDRVGILEAQLAQAKLIAEEADKKYEEVARKLVLMEQDLERSEEKVEMNESKIVELEEELRVVGNNLKSLEVSEEKAMASRDSVEDKIHQLNDKLTNAEARAEFAERSVQKLQKEVDRLEDELIVEKLRYAEIGDDLDFAFVDLIPGIDPIWTERRPKPKTPPPPPKLPTPPPPPPAPKEEAAAAAGGEGEAAAAGGEGAPAGPTKARTPSPFELRKHFPPEAAEVPYVRSSTGTTPKSSPAKEVAPAEAAPAPEAAAPAEAPAEGGADAAAPPAEAAAPAAEGEAPAAPAAEGEAAAPAPEAAAAPAEEAAPPAAEPAPEAPAS
uniref:uncharacterized protein LOC120953866 isoform X6 n=1 Tax=Anopheles coluzzii TaxID=1518534 RepID=UPI0020FFEDB4|nr:uncharacterized protein LOC120953866 isoform X6 [Anopheles coluzzii]